MSADRIQEVPEFSHVQSQRTVIYLDVAATDLKYFVAGVRCNVIQRPPQTMQCDAQIPVGILLGALGPQKRSQR